MTLRYIILLYCYLYRHMQNRRLSKVVVETHGRRIHCLMLLMENLPRPRHIAPLLAVSLTLYHYASSRHSFKHYAASNRSLPTSLTDGSQPKLPVEFVFLFLFVLVLVLACVFVFVSDACYSASTNTLAGKKAGWLSLCPALSTVRPAAGFPLSSPLPQHS
jgi:hypothetical protein